MADASTIGHTPPPTAAEVSLREPSWLHRCDAHDGVVYVTVRDGVAVDEDSGEPLCDRGLWWPLRRAWSNG